MSDFIFVIPKRGKLNESIGPDIEEILRDLVREHMKSANRPVRELANSLGISTRSVNDWLAGKPGSISLMSRFVAAAGLDNCDQLLCAHPAYERSSHKVASIQALLLARLGRMSSLEDIRLMMDIQLAIETVPEVKHIIRRGILDSIDYAEHRGADVQSARASLERTLLRTTGRTSG
jgi:hypothetical protein